MQEVRPSSEVIYISEIFWGSVLAWLRTADWGVKSVKRFLVKSSGYMTAWWIGKNTCITNVI